MGIHNMCYGLMEQRLNFLDRIQKGMFDTKATVQITIPMVKCGDSQGGN